MSLEYSNHSHTMTLICDTCGDTDEFFGTFRDCMIDVKEDGWWISKVGDEWHHTCPLCAHKTNDWKGVFDAEEEIS